MLVLITSVRFYGDGVSGLRRFDCSVVVRIFREINICGVSDKKNFSIIHVGDGIVKTTGGFACFAISAAVNGVSLRVCDFDCAYVEAQSFTGKAVSNADIFAIKIRGNSDSVIHLSGFPVEWVSVMNSVFVNISLRNNIRIKDNIFFDIV